MAAEGAHVGILDIDSDAAARTSQSIIRSGGESIAITGDVTSIDAVTEALQTCVERWGRLDTLVNNAGVMSSAHQALTELGEADWDRMMAVNVKGPFLCIRTAAEFMRNSGGGTIVNITSIGGRLGYPGRGAYGVSKAALESLTLQAAVELGQWNIRVNSVSPGWFATAMTAYAYSRPDEARRRQLTVPLGRIGIPEDVARLVVFLAGPDAEYISGASIEIDGALLAAALKSTFDLAKYRPTDP
jgi:NAD(P)-dependent dehydrogenase (short-subunit alcohol dehydrogenase family)